MAWLDSSRSIDPTQLLAGELDLAQGAEDVASPHGDSLHKGKPLDISTSRRRVARTVPRSPGSGTTTR